MNVASVVNNTQVLLHFRGKIDPIQPVPVPTFRGQKIVYRAGKCPFR